MIPRATTACGWSWRRDTTASGTFKAIPGRQTWAIAPAPSGATGREPSYSGPSSPVGRRYARRLWSWARWTWPWPPSRRRQRRAARRSKAAREAQAVAESLLRRDPTDQEATSLLGQRTLPPGHRPGPGRVASRMAARRGDLRPSPGQAARRPQAPAQRRPGTEVPRLRTTSSGKTSRRRWSITCKPSRWTNGAWPPIPPTGPAQLDVAIDLSNVALAHWQCRPTGRGGGRVRAEPGDARPTCQDRSRRTRIRAAAWPTRTRGSGAVYSELGRHAEALRHAEDGARISESQAPINATYAELFAENVRLLGEAQLAADRVPAACASFRRSQALLAGLSAKGISESSDLARGSATT